MAAPRGDSYRSLFLGSALVLGGFLAGFIAGQESTRDRTAPPGTAAVHDHDHGRGDQAVGPARMPEARGHSFTGDIQVPPHGEKGHSLAASVLAGAACPCGGCAGMWLLECGCDTAREIEGLAAHLLERGRPPEEVLAQLGRQYGLVTAAAPPAALPSLPDALSGLSGVVPGPAVRGPVDVPTGARRTASP